MTDQTEREMLAQMQSNFDAMTASAAAADREIAKIAAACSAFREIVAALDRMGLSRSACKRLRRLGDAALAPIDALDRRPVNFTNFVAELKRALAEQC